MPNEAVTLSRRNVAAMARKHADKAVQTLVDAMDDPDPKTRIDAATRVLDRAIGKPTQPVSGDEDHPGLFDPLTALLQAIDGKTRSV